MAFVVVCDAGPLIALEQIARLDLLRTLYGQVIVPTVVAREVTPTLPVLPEWIEVRGHVGTPRSPLAQGRLDDGEFAAILLARVLAADVIVLDDLDARIFARRLGLAIVGTAGILLRAKRAGAIAAVRPLLDELLASGLFLGGAVIHEVLEDAGELPYP